MCMLVLLGWQNQKNFLKISFEDEAQAKLCMVQGPPLDLSWDPEKVLVHRILYYFCHIF